MPRGLGDVYKRQALRHERETLLARQLEQQYAAVRLCTMEDAEAYVRNR